MIIPRAFPAVQKVYGKNTSKVSKQTKLQLKFDNFYVEIETRVKEYLHQIQRDNQNWEMSSASKLSNESVTYMYKKSAEAKAASVKLQCGTSHSQFYAS